MKGGQLTQEERIYAKLASAAYLKDAAPDFEAFQRDRSYGAANSLVYVNDGAREVVLAIRGTQPRNPQDLLSDVEIARLKSGLTNGLQNTTRFKQLSDRVLDISRKYSGYKLVLVGHSLGGELARVLLLRHPKLVSAVYSFNPGTGFGQVLRGLAGKMINSKENQIMKQKLHIFRVGGDPISFMSALLPSKKNQGERAVSRVNLLANHTIANFTGAINASEPNSEPKSEPQGESELNPAVTGGNLKYISNKKLRELLRKKGVKGRLSSMSKKQLLELARELNL